MSTTPLALRVEEAGLRAWPAKRSEREDGWVIRLDAGYTNRVNSITALAATERSMAAKVLDCQARLARTGRRCRFRLLSFNPEFMGLDAHLAQLGYRCVSPTRVQVADIPAELPEPSSGSRLRSVGLSEWIAGFSRLSGQDVETAEKHACILERIPPPVEFLHARRQGRLVGAALGVCDDDLIGLFDFVVRSDVRREGIASDMLYALMAWGRDRGAGKAYLQVVARNRPAGKLYARSGFRNLYNYWYRVAAR